MNEDHPNAPIRLGFTRGVSPSKWARRWAQAMPARALELVPFERAYGLPVGGDASDADTWIVRCAPGAEPEQLDEQGVRTHHAMLLYEESVGLVVPHDHELAEQSEVRLDELALIRILDHPNHAEGWPTAAAWDDPSWMPRSLPATLALVATGTGGIIAPFPLARHLMSKHDHALLSIVSDEPLPGTTIWAVWRVDHDSSDLQQLAGIMRGRTANSSRTDRSHESDAKSSAPKKPQQRAKKQPTLKPNSRGAQLAAAREKAERAKAAKRKAKKRR